MSFLYPQFLFALAALLIPVIIHLFNFRRYKKILFTNVSVLKDIETSTKSVRNLKNLLVLLTRILGLAFLVFAFAQPILPLSERANSNLADRVVIFIDNSHSMGVYANEKSQLDFAKSAALEVVNNRGHEVTFHILTNDFMQSEMNGVTTEDALTAINAISITPNRRSFKEIVTRIHALSEQNPSDEIQCYIISDYQRNQFDLSEVPSDSTLFFNLVKTGNKQVPNLSVDSCWLVNIRSTLEGNDSITVRLKNYGAEDIEKQGIRLYVNERQVWMGSVQLSANSKNDITIPLDHHDFGNYNCRIELSDNTLDFDNHLYFSYQIDSATAVYFIGSEKYSAPFEAVFYSPFRYNHDLETNADLSILNISNCIIHAGSGNLSSGLIDVISERVKDGASLILIPSDKALSGEFNKILSRLSAGQLQQYDTTKTNISEINLSSNLLSSVIRKLPDNPNLPWVHGHYNLKSPIRSSVEDVLLFDKGPALRRIPLENGNVFLFSFDLEESKSNMVRHSLFVPIMINAAFSGNRQYSLYHFLNHNELVKVDFPSGTDEVFHLIGKEIDVIPEIKRLPNGTSLQLDDQLRYPGSYEIRLSNKFVRNVSFNYGREESNLDLYSENEIEVMLSSNSKFNGALYSGDFEEVMSSLGQSATHVSLWKYCIILALMFFISEALILKLVKS